MVEIVSALVGFAAIPFVVVVALSYYALYARGQRSVSESSHYVNTRDIETYRGNSVRDEELKNTEASVRNERPTPTPDAGDENGNS